jgi:NDP-sugar pyrophosphorylase family protein
MSAPQNMPTGPDQLRISRFIGRWNAPPLDLADDLPWNIVVPIEAIIRAALARLDSDYRIEGEIAVHRTATIEAGAVLKPPVLIGPRCFVAVSAYLRGGVFLDEDCIVGPSCELKSSLMFQGSKVAHLNFVGDSILGMGVNVEAGAMIANYRNELEDKSIRFRYGDLIVETEVEKFGALVGDHSRIGANAVVAPGAIFARGARVPRLSLVDLHPGAGLS